MRWTATILVLAAVSATALGVLKFPPPQFTKPHPLPPITTPSPGDRPGAYTLSADAPPLARYLDAVLLSAVLAVGAYLAMAKAAPSVLLAMVGCVLIFFGLWDELCRTLLPPGGGDFSPFSLMNLVVPAAACIAGMAWGYRRRLGWPIWLGAAALAVHAGIWNDHLAGSWGVITRVAWLFFLPTQSIRLPFALEYLDVALLAGAILLAAHLALKARNRNAILALTLFSLLHFGFWRQGCICPIGAIQTAAAALFDRSYAISPIVILFFLLPLVLTVFFGRSFCAAVCPLGALQDVVVVRAVRVPAPLAHALRMLAWVYLGAAVLLAAVGSAFIICQYDPFVALFRLDGSFEMLVLGAAFVAMGLFIARPYCRFLCPYGAILRVLSACSWRRVTITPAECVRCKLCEDSCPFGAIRPANAAEPPPPRRQGRRALAGMLVLLPVLVLAGRWGVGKLAAPLARTHEMVRLAERIAAEDSGRQKQHNDATAALAAMLPGDRQTRITEIRAKAAAIEARFRTGARWLGALLGLVIGLKLVGLSVRRRRDDYIADPATCVSCGRCFAACPVERHQRKHPERD